MDWKVFPANKENYYSMLDYVIEIAEKNNIPEEKLMSLELGFEEAASNVINYAYGDKSGKIFIRAYCEGENFFIELKDSGKKFNPLDVDVKDKNFPKDLDDAQIGGFGIMFMHQIFDEINYNYCKEGKIFYNWLKMCIKINKE
ncbi:MAG: ATP-binding protein [Selenomonadaceae bacterium]|nr:ATP-binding protein [Selenomonadaceae bacterium]